MADKHYVISNSLVLPRMTVKSLFMGEVYITGDDYVLSESYSGLTQT